jgi:hypothetical protein
MTYQNVTIKYRPSIFSNESAALRWAECSTKFNRVILAEVGVFLVVCNADAMRLVRGGYELI